MIPTVLISIRREHNKEIFARRKRFEGRKTVPRILQVRNDLDPTMTYVPSDTDVRFIIYEPKSGGGCGKVVGEFIADFAQSFHRAGANFAAIGKALCVTEAFAEQYFDRDVGYMIRVRSTLRYPVPVSLKAYDRRLKPPQSWRYLKTP